MPNRGEACIQALEVLWVNFLIDVMHRVDVWFQDGAGGAEVYARPSFEQQIQQELSSQIQSENDIISINVYSVTKYKVK